MRFIWGPCRPGGRLASLTERLGNVCCLPLGVLDLRFDVGEVEGGLVGVESAQDLEEVGGGEELARGVPAGKSCSSRTS